MKTWFFLFPVCLFALGSSEVFRKYPNLYFVETGLCLGDGVNQALQAGFPEIHSIEISDRLYKRGVEQFKDAPQVHIWLGDSGIVLERVIAMIEEPITFWLDSHFSGDEYGKGDTNTPILQELETIARHPVKNHTILVDDVRLFETSEFDNIQLTKVMDTIRAINPLYQFSYENGYKQRDILVARVR